MTESEFRAFNDQRLGILKVLVQEAESASKACDRWLASGHISDYRTWRRRAKDVEEADARYAEFRSLAR